MTDGVPLLLGLLSHGCGTATVDTPPSAAHVVKSARLGHDHHMAGKEIRIHGRRFEVYDWAEHRDASLKSPSTGEPILGTFKVTLPIAPPVGASVDLDGDDYGIVESIGPPDQHDFALGKFLIRGSLFAK